MTNPIYKVSNWGTDKKFSSVANFLRKKAQNEILTTVPETGISSESIKKIDIKALSYFLSEFKKLLAGENGEGIVKKKKRLTIDPKAGYLKKINENGEVEILNLPYYSTLSKHSGEAFEISDFYKNEEESESKITKIINNISKFFPNDTNTRQEIKNSAKMLRLAMRDIHLSGYSKRSILMMIDNFDNLIKYVNKIKDTYKKMSILDELTDKSDSLGNFVNLARQLISEENKDIWKDTKMRGAIVSSYYEIDPNYHEEFDKSIKSIDSEIYIINEKLRDILKKHGHIKDEGTINEILTKAIGFDPKILRQISLGISSLSNLNVSSESEMSYLFENMDDVIKQESSQDSIEDFKEEKYDWKVLLKMPPTKNPEDPIRLAQDEYLKSIGFSGGIEYLENLFPELGAPGLFFDKNTILSEKYKELGEEFEEETGLMDMGKRKAKMTGLFYGKFRLESPYMSEVLSAIQEIFNQIEKEDRESTTKDREINIGKVEGFESLLSKINNNIFSDEIKKTGNTEKFKKIKEEEKDIVEIYIKNGLSNASISHKIYNKIKNINSISNEVFDDIENFVSSVDKNDDFKLIKYINDLLDSLYDFGNLILKAKGEAKRYREDEENNIPKEISILMGYFEEIIQSSKILTDVVTGFSQQPTGIETKDFSEETEAVFQEPLEDIKNLIKNIYDSLNNIHTFYYSNESVFKKHKNLFDFEYATNSIEETINAMVDIDSKLDDSSLEYAKEMEKSIKNLNRKIMLVYSKYKSIQTGYGVERDIAEQSLSEPLSGDKYLGIYGSEDKNIGKTGLASIPEYLQNLFDIWKETFDSAVSFLDTSDENNGKINSGFVEMFLNIINKFLESASSYGYDIKKPASSNLNNIKFIYKNIYNAIYNPSKVYLSESINEIKNMFEEPESMERPKPKSTSKDIGKAKLIEKKIDPKTGKEINIYSPGVGNVKYRKKKPTREEKQRSEEEYELEKTYEPRPRGRGFSSEDEGPELIESFNLSKIKVYSKIFNIGKIKNAYKK